MAQAIRPHGVGVRGSALTRTSVLFEGPFGRLFRTLPPGDYGVDDAASMANLAKLADKMTADLDEPFDGPDDEESGIPAAFTYFGQFIDHDLTFDPASSLQRQNDPDALVDYRTPRFDLDNIYGRGPDDQPYLYADSSTFLLGEPLTGAPNSAFDLPRAQNPAVQRAIIGDPRNDENVIISQLQGLFHRFHNGIASLHTNWTMAQIQREVRFHYQWVVLNDFLPAIIDADVLATILPHISNNSDLATDPPQLSLYKPKKEAFMPLEFAAAAYRFGHSMVRPGYRLNDAIGPLAIFDADPFKGLTGFRKFPVNWALDWARFADLEPRPYGNPDDKSDPKNTRRLQLAYKIDTSLVNPLGNLPETVGPGVHSLARRNLLRGWRMRLPTGQAIARAMGLAPLDDKDILIGKFTGDAADIRGNILDIDPAFIDNTPLWTYVLAETKEVIVTVETTDGPKQITTRHLGDVGGRLVGETIVGIMCYDSTSFVSQNPLWTPDTALQHNGRFGLRELIAFALKH